MNFVMKDLTVGRSREHLTLIFLMLIVVAGGAIAFSLPYVSNTNVLVGLCLLPFVCFIQGARGLNFPYLLLVIITASLAYTFNVRIFYFFALACYVMFVIEWGIGSVGRLAPFL